MNLRRLCQDWSPVSVRYLPQVRAIERIAIYSVAPVLKRDVMRLVLRGWLTLFSRMAKRLIVSGAPEAPVLSSSLVVSTAYELSVHVVVLLSRRNVSNRIIPQHKCFLFFLYFLNRLTAGSPSRL